MEKRYYIPVDILLIVVNGLALKDFLSFRIVCRLFYKVASRQVYHKNYLTILQNSGLGLKISRLPNKLLHGLQEKRYYTWYEYMNYYENLLHGTQYAYDYDYYTQKCVLTLQHTYQHGELSGPFTEYFYHQGKLIDLISGTFDDGKISGTFNYKSSQYIYDSTTSPPQSVLQSYYYKLENGHCIELTYDIILEAGKRVKMIDFVGRYPIFPRETLAYEPRFCYLHNTVLRALQINSNDCSISGINDIITYKNKCVHSPCGNLRVWYQNGKLKYDQHFYRIDNHFGLTGWRETYYENGQIKSRTQYRNGSHIGWLYKYFENGQLNVKTYYNNFARQDGVTFQFSNGYPRTLHHYDDGLLKEQIWYHPGPGNRIYSIGKYKHGQKYEVVYYNIKGFLIAKHNYIRDITETTLKEDDYSVTFTHSKRHGISLIYNGHPSERVINEIPYDKAIIEGQVVIYYNNGKLHKKFTYKNNRPNGYYEVYNKKGLLIECGEKSQFVDPGVRMRNSRAVWHNWRKLWDFNGRLICEQYYEDEGILIRENQYKYLVRK